MSRDGVTINGFELLTQYIANFDTSHDYTLQFTITYTLVTTVTSSLLLIGSASNGGHSPSLGS